MQAIQTKYLGPSNYRGARIKAWCEAGSLTIDYPDELSGQACHRKAAESLQAKLGWDEQSYSSDRKSKPVLLGGALPGNAGYCFIFDNVWARD